MFKNFIKVALRHIRREKFYSFINIAGLAVGLASCILIGLYVFDELNFDRFHKNKDHIGRLIMVFSQGSDVNMWAYTGTKPGPLFSRSIPAVKNYCRMVRRTRIVSWQNNSFEEQKFLYADSTFFDIFTFSVLKGNPLSALDAPDRIVLSRTAARKYFGDEDPLGKILRVDMNKDFIVSAIAEDPPGNSQIDFDFIVSFTNLSDAWGEQWFPANFFTYLLLDEHASISETGVLLDHYMNNNITNEELGIGKNNHATFYLEPLTKVHLYSEMDSIRPNGSITYIYMISIIAFLILLIACVNYTNLAIAQSTGRQREISMRKVLGSQRSQLFHFFIAESTVLAALATLLAVLIAYECMPLFNNITGKSLSLSVMIKPEFLWIPVFLCLLVGLFSGFYPAMVQSRINLMRAFRSGDQMNVSGSTFRKTLIIFQFVITIFLIIAVLIIQQQRSFIQKKNLGYNKENIVVLSINHGEFLQYYAMKDALENSTHIHSVSAGYEPPTFIHWTNGVQATTTTGAKNFSTKATPVDLDFLKTFGITILSGSDYTEADFKDMKANYQKENYQMQFMINESALKQLGWTPEEAIGQSITCGKAGTIKAVVKDFHISSLHTPIPPLVMFLSDQFLNRMFIKIDGSDTQETLAGIEKIWKERVPESPFNYHFLDEDYDSLYRVELRTARFTNTFAGLAIILACLGLFGLSAYMGVQRTKEIGIRKVLGATVNEIVLMLSRDFVVLVMIACLFAIPAGWYIASRWLEGFAYHIDMEPWIFLLAGSLALLITLLTVSFQSIKAALHNPVDSLRNE